MNFRVWRLLPQATAIPPRQQTTREKHMTIRNTMIAAAALLTLASNAFAGDPTGANAGFADVSARSTDVYAIPFAGGEPALVTVRGDGDTDLDLYVYDENGNLICSDTDYTDQLICSWSPRWTGMFRIEVRNLGNVYNRYQVRTN